MQKIYITSLDEYVRFVNSLEHDKKNYIYRGQASRKWDLIPTSTRRIKIEKHEKHILYHKEIVEKAKKQNLNYKESGQKLTNLEILAELQHNGAATGLLDFTKNALVALYFACLPEDDDGKVFIVENKNFKNINNKYLDTKKNFSENKVCFWEPPPNNNRIIRQYSAFLFGKMSFNNINYNSVYVRKEHKEKILKELKLISQISEESIFYDLSGFCKANSATSDYTNYSKEEYFKLGENAFFEDNYKASIKYFNNAQDEGYSLLDVCFFRGRALYNLKNYEKAIKNFDKALELVNDDNNLEQKIHYFRGETIFEKNNAKKNIFLRNTLSDFDEAIGAFRNCIAINRVSYLGYQSFQYLTEIYEKLGFYGNVLICCYEAIQILEELAKKESGEMKKFYFAMIDKTENKIKTIRELPEKKKELEN